jgi:hypothetical protein
MEVIEQTVPQPDKESAKSTASAVPGAEVKQIENKNADSTPLV